MKTIVMIIISGLFLAVSCCKEELTKIQTDKDGVIISLPNNWKRPLHLSTPVSSSGLQYPIYYKGNIVIPITNGGTNRLLAMVNSNSGDILWKWDDRYDMINEDVSIFYYYQFSNLLTYQNGGRSYCINLDDGSTFWKFRRDSSFDVRIFTDKDGYYFNNTSDIINDKGYNEAPMFRFDINTGKYTEFLRANYSGEYIAPNNLVGAITNINKVPGNDSLYSIVYAEPLPNWNVNSFLGLYNQYSKKWIYERKLMAPPTQNTSVQTPPQIYNGKLYANCGYRIVCHDVGSGEQLWTRDFGADFMFSGFIIADNKIIGSCENEMLYCLNPEDGNIIWSTKGSGTSSRLAFLNGVVYFVGGGDGKLHAVDVSTGKTVWLLDAKNIDGTIFASYNPVFVFPAEGNKPARVIALTLGNACCFEAYK